ncbi:hypothetical protein FF1_033355 [Malus domestica]
MADEVRPLPPQPSQEKADLGFDVLDRVDVLDNKGWWVGTVTEKRGEDEYWVYFETTADHIAYPKRILRFHKDWIDGMWVNYNKKKRAFRADGKPVECKKRTRGSMKGLKTTRKCASMESWWIARASYKSQHCISCLNL